MGEEQITEKVFFDAVMIKDNHFLILERENNIGINSAIKKVRAKKSKFTDPCRS